jgi:transposase
MGRRSQYPEEFRQRAALSVIERRRSIREVAAELGINHETLRNWGERREAGPRRGSSCVAG